MTNDDKQNMDAHDISYESQNIYHYKDFKYDRLTAAVRCAEIDANRLNDDDS